MHISGLKKRGATLIEVYVDGESAGRFDYQCYLDMGLRRGDDITPETLDDLASRSSRRRAEHKALRALALRDHSKGELVRKLQNTTDADTARDIAARVEELGLIDEEGYARKLARELACRRGWADSRIRQELLSRGLPRGMIDEALDGLPEADERIAFVLDKKASARKDPQRLIDLLWRYGHSYTDIKAALRGRIDGGEDEAWD